MLAALCVGVVVVGFSSWVAWQARGLESRVVEAVRPHLATDVSIGMVSVSLWSAWPDVEVVLGDVRIEDALIRGRDFLEFDEIGFRVACLPLLENRLEVRALRLEGGTVRLERAPTGGENWRFWTQGGGESGSLGGWRIERLEVRDVEVEGLWEGPGERVAWSGHVVASDMALASMEGGLDWKGKMEADRVVLDTGSDRWLDGRSILCSLDGNVVDGRVKLAVADAFLGDGERKVELEGALVSESGDFRMSLKSERYSIGAADVTLPPAVHDALAPILRGLDGEVRLEVGIGLPLDRFWKGPATDEWDGAWAVRLGPRGTRWTEDPGRMEWVSGPVEVFSRQGGWKASGRSVVVGAAGGEFSGDAEVVEDGGALRVMMEGRGVFRPAGIWALSGLSGQSPWDRLEVRDGGRVDVDGGLELTIRQGASAQWNILPGSSAFLSDLSMTQDGGAILVERIEASKTEDGRGGALTLSGLALPGASGRVEARWTDGSGFLEADLVRLDVDDLLPMVDGLMDGAEGNGDGLPGLWRVDVECGPVEQGPLMLDRMSMEGNWKDGVFEVEEMEAAGMDGRVEAWGRIDGERARLEGRLVDGDLAQVLEGTSGLGQTILLPRHVRGRVWAEGAVAHVFGRTEAVPWDADVRVHLEKTELIGFELLQQIPDVLESERKYRLISDVQDLRRRLNRVRFDPVDARVVLERGLITLDPVGIGSDAMDVGVEGWYRMGGPMDFTLDFALRDLKSEDGEFGPVEEDGLGHRFFLAIGGTMEEPEFGYDRNAHQVHRREERKGAWSRLRGAILRQPDQEGPGAVRTAVIQSDSSVVDSISAPGKSQPSGSRPVVDDDDDDF